MNSENKKLVIFDFDGVLANTEECSYQIHKNVNGDLTWEKFQGFADGNFHEIMGKAVEKEGYIVPTNYYDLYKDHLLTIDIHDILKETILQLKDTYRLAIVSSTRGSYIADFLKKEKVLNYFDDILGHEVHASKIIKINNLLQKYNIESENAVLITDSLGDITEANECNVRSIGVTWGLHERKTLEKGNPVIVIDEPSILLKTVSDVLK